MARRCINYNHPLFLNYQKTIGTYLSPIILGTSIPIWQEDNGLERFPTKKELIKDLNKRGNPVKQHIGSSRALRTIAENEEENLINNGIRYIGSGETLELINAKELTMDEALNEYIEDQYNDMLKMDTAAANELLRKADIVKAKIARAYKILYKENIDISSDSFKLEDSEEVITEDIKTDKEESGSLEQSWTDNIDSVDSISLASVNLKRNISFLPSRYNEGSKKGQVIYDRFGNPELLELESAYGFLQNKLAQSGTKQDLMDRLKDLTEVRTEFKPLYDALILPANQQLSAQFYKLMNFTKNEESMSKVLFLKDEDTENKDKTKKKPSGVKIQVLDSDRVNAPKQIEKSWVKNFNDLKEESNFYITEVVNKETVEVLNNEVFKPSFDKISDIKESNRLEANKEELYNDLSEILETIGVKVNPLALKAHVNENTEKLNSLVAGVYFLFKKTYEDSTNPLKNSYITTLAKIQSGYQYVDAVSTFTNIEGNKKQSFIVPSAKDKLMTSYKSKDGVNILNTLALDPSFYNSHLTKLLKEHPEDVNWKTEGGIKEDKPNGEGVSYSNMSPLELEFTKLIKFVNTTKKANSSNNLIGQVFTLVPSDGSTMPVLQVPILRGDYTTSDNPAFVQSLGAGVVHNYADNYAEMLFDLFVQEQIKVKEALVYRSKILALQSIEEKTPEQTQEIKYLEENAIELYDFKYNNKGGKDIRDYSRGAASILQDFDIFSDEVKYNSTIKESLGITFQQAQALVDSLTYEIAESESLFEIEDKYGVTHESIVKIDISEEAKDKLKQILFAWLVKEKQEQYNRWNSLGITNQKFRLNDYVGNNLKYRNYEELALEYVFNSFLYSAETQKLFTGDVAFSGSKVNYQKRAKSMVSPSLTPDLESMDRSTYMLGVIRDVIKPSEFIDNMKLGLANIFKDEANINKIIKPYTNINVGDGMGYLHYKEALNIYKGLGDYGKKYSDAITDIANGNPTEQSLSIMLQMVKDNHVSITYDPIRKLTVKKYIKNAKLILFPALVKNTPLQEMYDYMDSTGTHHMLYESGKKQGAKGVEQLESKGKYDFSKLYNIVPEEQSYEFWGLQSDTPEHHIDGENKLGVQVAKLITQGLADDFEFSDGTKAENLKREYRELQTKNILEDYEELIKSIQTDEQVRDLILEQLSDAVSDNAIALFDLDTEGNFKSPLFLNMEFCKKVESILNGLYKNRVVNQKMNGGSSKQASAFGLINKQNFKNLKELNTSEKQGINWLKGNEGRLDFYKYDNGSIKSAQCLLPYWSKQFIKDGSIIDINDPGFPAELRQIIGYRIPTQSKSSMFALEVVGFLPKEAGSTIILPEEVTVLMGSDFDIDTLYTMIPNFKSVKTNKKAKSINKEIIERNKDVQILTNLIIKNNRNNKNNTVNLESLRLNDVSITLLLKELKDIENSEKDKNIVKDNKDYEYFYYKVTDDSKEGRDNRIQDIFRNILLEPKLFNETIAPLDSTYLRDVANKIEALTGKESIKGSVNLPYIQTEMSMNNMMGKALIGAFANVNANRSIAEDTKLTISDSNYSIKFNGLEATELFNTKNYKNNLIANQISEMLSAAVDNAKELIHYIINSNLYTASVYNLILESGHDLTTTSYFMLQPSIVKSYEKQKLNSGINREFEKTNEIIKKEYKDKLSKDSLLILEKELLDNKTFNFNDDRLQESIIISNFLLRQTKLKKEVSKIEFDNYIKSDKIKNLGLKFDNWNKDNFVEDYNIMQVKTLHSFESYKKLASQRNLIIKNQKIDGYDENSLAGLEIVKNNIENGDTNLFDFKKGIIINQEATQKALISNEEYSAINFISKYIPFNSPAFKAVKTKIINKLGIQDKLKSSITGIKVLDKINYEILTAINGNTKSPFFKNKNSTEYIKQLVTDKGLYKDYNKIIKKYPFLKNNYFISKINFNKNQELIFDIGILQKKSTERLQNSFEELLTGFGIEEADKEVLKRFSFNLIRYSYLTKGFQVGFDSFIKYVPSDWLQSDKLGYNDFIKEVQSNLQDPEFISNELVDEIISNLSNINDVVRYISSENPIVTKTTFTIESKQDLPKVAKIFFGGKVLDLKLDNHNDLSDAYIYKIIKPLGRKANSKKSVGLKEYSGKGLNFKEKIIVNKPNVTSTGKPIINQKTIEDKGKDVEDICKKK